MRYATPIIALALLLISGCTSTKLPSDTEYQTVRDVEGASADQIYERSLNWMAETFVSANEAVQVRDDENDRLVTNASIRIPGYAGFSEMSIIVEARDERFRFTARNFQARTTAMSMRVPMNTDLYEDLKPKLKSRADELQSYIRGETEDTDW
jgi:hypothetical protein